MSIIQGAPVLYTKSGTSHDAVALMIYHSIVAVTI